MKSSTSQTTPKSERFRQASYQHKLHFLKQTDVHSNTTKIYSIWAHPIDISILTVMYGTLTNSSATYCKQCLRRYAFASSLDIKALPMGSLFTRGKKRMRTINGPQETVKLLKPMKGIGRKGEFRQSCTLWAS